MKKVGILFFMVTSFFFLLAVTNTVAKADNVIKNDVCDVNGSPLVYGKKYYIRHIGSYGRGGITFEPHLSYDNLLFANDDRNNGTPQTLVGQPDGEIVKTGSYVRVVSSEGNWAKEREWATRSYLTDGLHYDMILKQSGDRFFVTGDRVDGKGHVGLGKIEGDGVMNYPVFYNLQLVVRVMKQGKLWLYMNRQNLVGGLPPQSQAVWNGIYGATNKELSFIPVNN